MISACQQSDLACSALVERRSLARYIPLGVWLISVLALAWIPLKVVSYGYLPPDDALRHAAKAVSGRPWSDVMVLRPDFQMDHNPGWHWFLGHVHQSTQLGTDGLVVFAVVLVFLAVFVGPLLLFKRPEGWLAAVLVSCLFFPALSYRVFLGRPLGLTIAIMLTMLLLWRRVESRPSSALLIGSTLLLALSAWMHGSWYLFSLVVAAFVLAGQLNAGLWLGGCWLTGSFLGALCTGHPIAFLVNALRIAHNCFAGDALQRWLAFEFWPSDGNVLALVAIAVLLFWRHAAGRWTWKCVNDPVFLLVVIGWVLGLRVGRFYADWGAPALVLWVALELSEHFVHLLQEDSPRRLLVTGALAASVCFSITADANGRWTNSLNVEFLTQSDPAMSPWLPEQDGILYSADMSIFYQTYFKNPQGRWRYMLGFEPTFMPPEDLKIYRNIQRNLGSFKAYEPWVKKMKPADRLVIRGDESPASALPQLEWHYTARETWIGRLPRASEIPVLE